MSKFSQALAVPNMRTRTPVSTVRRAQTLEGGSGHRLDPQSRLFTAAVASMCEPKFYDATDGVAELARNARDVALQFPEWVAGFVPYLRDAMNMRSASIVVAAEYAAVGAPNSRAVIREACKRADEPAEMLAYWLGTHGRRIPQRVKRGIADAARNLYNEYTCLKYDGQSRQVRMADVLNLTHPKPADEHQAALFRWLLDRRHGNATPDLTLLPRVAADASLTMTPAHKRRAAINGKAMSDAGWTWERLAGWIPGGMDADAWSAAIPTMGYMALIRNLRNFENAGVPADILDDVAARIADPREVARSKQFPYRFFSAYLFSGTMRFGPALEAACEYSLANIPKLNGRTLVMVDTSASMSSSQTAGKIRPVDVAALFAAGLSSAGDVDLAIYASDAAYVRNAPRSLLRTAELLRSLSGQVGHGTNTWPATNVCYDGHDRVVVLTDMQDHPHDIAALPDVPIYVWDLAGYGTANLQLGAGRHLLSGFTDSHFKMIQMLESGRDADWPWL